jgi:hypothetical protein
VSDWKETAREQIIEWAGNHHEPIIFDTYSEHEALVVFSLTGGFLVEIASMANHPGSEPNSIIVGSDLFNEMLVKAEAP